MSVDPFDLPDWLGTEQVTWSSDGAGLGGALLRGSLSGAEARLPCDLLAVDEAHPAPVADPALRQASHLAWHHGEVLLHELEGRLTLAVPGTAFTADRVIESLGRLAGAVSAPRASYAVWLRIGG